MSYKPQVKVAGNGDKWCDNALRFATMVEAEQSAHDLMMRWMLVTDCRGAPSDDPVNYAIVDSVMVEIKPATIGD
jgi:hypothetical protein